MDNVRMMLLSKIGEPYSPETRRGTIGRNYNYQSCSFVTGFFDGEYMNPFIGAGALAVQIDDFNGDHFDHSDLDFIGGGGIMGYCTDGRPIQHMNSLRPGTKRWGSEWKAGYARDYIRNSWGNQASEVMAEDVEVLRKQTGAREKLATPVAN